VLYRCLFVRSIILAKHLVQTFEFSNRRSSCVRKLDLRYERLPTYYTDYDWGEILLACGKLRDLTFESPYCNHGIWDQAGKPWGDFMGRLFLDILPILPFLARIELHVNSQESRYYLANDFATTALFANEVLQVITVSCMTLEGPRTRRALGSRAVDRTPLKRLRLIECNLDLDALDSILAVPNALEVLELGK
jgi:hypothetical protein